MHGRKKLWLLILAAVVAGFVAYRYTLSTSSLFNCANTVLSEAVSPDSRYTAAVFERNCGATSPFLRVVSIRTKGARFDGSIKKSWIFEAKDQPTVSVSWAGPQNLIVRHSASAEKLLELHKLGDVTIVAVEE
jgi:hypothetical protein